MSARSCPRKGDAKGPSEPGRDLKGDMVRDNAQMGPPLLQDRSNEEPPAQSRHLGPKSRTAGQCFSDLQVPG